VGALKEVLPACACGPWTLWCWTWCLEVTATHPLPPASQRDATVPYDRLIQGLAAPMASATIPLGPKRDLAPPLPAAQTQPTC
jgi:hypothetical protein